MAKENFLLVTTMKNEGPFMLEWVAYNLSIGFDSFLIFTNDCVDGTDRIAMRLEELELAFHIDNNYRGPRNLAPQRFALRKTLSHPAYKVSDWVICSDADEFLNIRIDEGTLPELVATSGPADAISLCWKLFGSGGRRHYDDIPITEQFFCAAPEDSYTNFRGAGLKTLFRSNGAFDRMGVHRPKRKGKEGVDPEKLYADLVWRDAGGNAFDADRISWKAWADFSHEYARLHHYSIRSADSFLVKRDRGRTNHVNVDQGRDYFKAMNANHTRDPAILKHVPRMLTVLEKLKSDKVLLELHMEAIDWHRKKIEELHARDDWQEFIAMTYEVRI